MKRLTVIFELFIIYYIAFALNALISIFRFGWNDIYPVRILLAVFMIVINVFVNNNTKRFIAANERNEQNEETKKVE